MELTGGPILPGKVTDFKIFPLSNFNKESILNKKQNVLFVLQLLIAFLYYFSIDYVNISLFSMFFNIFTHWKCLGLRHIAYMVIH